MATARYARAERAGTPTFMELHDRNPSGEGIMARAHKGMTCHRCGSIEVLVVGDVCVCRKLSLELRQQARQNSRRQFLILLGGTPQAVRNMERRAAGKEHNSKMKRMVDLLRLSPQVQHATACWINGQATANNASFRAQAQRDHDLLRSMGAGGKIGDPPSPLEELCCRMKRILWGSFMCRPDADPTLSQC